MPWLMAKFVSLGLGERVSRVLGYVTLIGSLIALLGLVWAIWLHFHDSRVIERHDTAIVAAVASATSSAEAVADANDQVRASERAADATQVKDAIHDAETRQPQAVRAPAGPAVNAVAERLRQQRAARHAGS